MLRYIALLVLVIIPLRHSAAQLAQDLPLAGIESDDARVQSLEDPAEASDEKPERVEIEPTLYYTVSRNAIVYRDADSTRPYLSLKFREPVHLVAHEGHWREVRTTDGARGYVLDRDISNTWIRVSKSEKTVYVYRGTELIADIPADLGYNTFSDKERRGDALFRDHWRTPEGTFYVVRKNPNSQYHKAFVINYPNAEDAKQGLSKNLISKEEYDAIVEADREGRMPPMSTRLGGMIEIHGNGTGGRTNWTQGCVAISDISMDRLWYIVEVGTPVLIEP